MSNSSTVVGMGSATAFGATGGGGGGGGGKGPVGALLGAPLAFD